jgi:hypothetical protein
MTRKAITAVGAVAAYALSLSLIGQGYNDTLLAVSGIIAGVAIALIMTEWVTQK